MVPTRVVVVDDEPGCADLVAARLERADACTVVASERDPDAALAVVQTTDVDCVVTDYDMPGRDGLEVIAAIHEVDPEIRCVLYTAYWSPELVRKAADSGVTACLRKDGGQRHFERLLRIVRDGRRAEPG